MFVSSTEERSEDVIQETESFDVFFTVQEKEVNVSIIGHGVIIESFHHFFESGLSVTALRIRVSRGECHRGCSGNRSSGDGNDSATRFDP
jgi:hypothetical protein